MVKKPTYKELEQKIPFLLPWGFTQLLPFWDIS